MAVLSKEALYSRKGGEEPVLALAGGDVDAIVEAIRQAESEAEHLAGRLGSDEGFLDRLADIVVYKIRRNVAPMEAGPEAMRLDYVAAQRYFQDIRSQAASDASSNGSGVAVIPAAHRPTAQGRRDCFLPGRSRRNPWLR